MARTKAVQMPAGIRNKLMASIAMLLVSTIMMVSTTYAWFTLSTAPEVTGITTSVGANGNLEMALLTTDTFANPDGIKSGTQDSSTANGKSVVTANVTWGNLVDLGDASYGLNLISLQPAALSTNDSGAVNTINMLKTPTYGVDGRVEETKANTISGIYSGGKFVQYAAAAAAADADEEETGATTAAPKQTYGVRAIGVDSTMSTAELVLNAARSNYTSSKNNATAAVASAVNQNLQTIITLAMNSSGKQSYTAEELAALKAVAEGVQSSLNTIVKAYSNALLAGLAASETPLDDETLGKLQTTLANNTDASTVTNALPEGVTNSYSVEFAALKTAQENVAAVLAKLTGESAYTSSTAATTITNDIVKPLIGDSSTVTALDAAGKKLDLSGVTELTSLTNADKVYIGGGLVNDIATYAGYYQLATATVLNISVTIYGGKYTVTAASEEGGADTVETITGKFVALTTAVEGMSASSNTTTTERAIADYYGYIIDFAFRTNAAGSYLQLQTEAANRVYSDGSAATQGGGSKVTFTYTDGLKFAQAQKLLGAIKLVFINPDDGTIYAKAGLTNIQEAEGAKSATADVKLTEQSLTGDNKTAILSMTQNTAMKVSVLVYLDGDAVDNAAVLATAATSGTLDLNLQFSSSATLVPMNNTALKNMVVTYTKIDLTNSDGKYTYGSQQYTVKNGYALYTGSDKMVYYAANVAEGQTPTYVKLTLANHTDVLEPVADTTTPSTPTTTYTVTFNKNDEAAEGTMDEVTGVSGTYTLPTGENVKFTNSGKTFKGWATSESGEAIVETTINVTANTTLYAIWGENA